MADRKLTTAVPESLRKAAKYIQSQVRSDGHWCGEVKSNTTVTSEYITLLYALELPVPDGPGPWISWLLSEQKPDGSWGPAPDIPGDISETIEAYFALKILGLDPEQPIMNKARDWILANGGVARVRIFTRIYLACFGLFPWAAIPELPPELIFVPDSAPCSIYYMASWARATVVPLLLISHHRPIFALPNGRSENNTYLDEIWCNYGTNKHVPYTPSLWSMAWKLEATSMACTVIDKALRFVNGMRNFPWRAAARRRCLEWILERQEEDGCWAGIFPPMHGGVLALYLEGHYSTDPKSPYQRGLAGLEGFIWTDQRGKRMQACVSPVWDTILSSIGLLDAGLPGENEYLVRSIAWLQARQDQDYGAQSPGDWRVLNPGLIPGAISFEYFNKWTPDVDDTAALIIALVKRDPRSIKSDSVVRAIQWILGMQNADGGWGAFDRENNKLFFNRIPFSDMESMCDPSTADVTGRAIEAFGLVMEQSILLNDNSLLSQDVQSAMKQSASRAIDYLIREQEPTGSWYGRWGANYIYGTSNVLCGLANAHFINNSRATLVDQAIKRGVDWLITVQNTDGGWGECLETYSRPSLAGQGKSTASQTGWALMGVLTSLPVTDLTVRRGVQYLLSTQRDDGAWTEKEFTGVGFPNHFYLGYVYYPHYFAMMGLGRYASLSGLKVLTNAGS